MGCIILSNQQESQVVGNCGGGTRSPGDDSTNGVGRYGVIRLVGLL